MVRNLNRVRGSKLLQPKVQTELPVKPHYNGLLCLPLFGRNYSSKLRSLNWMPQSGELDADGLKPASIKMSISRPCVQSVNYGRRCGNRRKCQPRVPQFKDDPILSLSGVSKRCRLQLTWFLPLDEAIVTRVVYVIVSGPDGRADGNAFEAS